MRVKISPRFVLKNFINKEGKKIIHCRLIIDRKKSEFTTGILIFEKDSGISQFLKLKNN